MYLTPNKLPSEFLYKMETWRMRPFSRKVRPFAFKASDTSSRDTFAALRRSLRRSLSTLETPTEFNLRIENSKFHIYNKN